MKVFKVLFNNNEAVAAFFYSTTYKGGSEVARHQGKPVIRSLDVIAGDEAESIIIANEIVNQYFRIIMN